MRRAPLVVFAVTLLVAILAITPWPVGVFQDDGIYVILAKSLATGHGYRYLNIPGAPAATHYPPLYPALLAALWRLGPTFPQNVALFKLVNAVLLAVSAVGAYEFGRRALRLGDTAAAVAAVATSACIPALILAGMVLSEPLFLALFFPTLLACERATAGDAGDGAWRTAALAGLLVGLLALTRTLGIVALPATAVVLLARRRWGALAAFTAVAVSVLAPWQMWVAAHATDIPPVLVGKYGSYTGWFADALKQRGAPFAAAVVARNARGLLSFFSIMLSSDGAAWLEVLTTAALVVALALGFRRLARLAPSTALFLAGYVALVIAWPFGPDRFLWGIWPLFGLLVAAAGGVKGVDGVAGLDGVDGVKGVEGVKGVNRAALLPPSRPSRLPLHPRALLPSIALASVCVVALGYGVYNARGFAGHWWDMIPRDGAERARTLAEWAGRYTDPRDVLATDDDVLLYLYTGRRTIPNNTFTPEEHVAPQPTDVAVTALSDIMRLYRPRYVLVSTVAPARAADRMVRASPPTLKMLGSLGRGAVFAAP